MPLRNPEPTFLKNAIASVVQQNYDGPLHLAVCDDGSDAAHARAIRQALSRPLPANTTTSLVTHGRARGIAAARNEACMSSDADWYVWLDGDDELRSDAVPVMVGIATQLSARLVLPQCMVRATDVADVHTNRLYVEQWRAEAGTRDDPFFQVVFPVHGCLVQRRLFWETGGFDCAYGYAELTDWFLRTACVVKAPELATSAEPLYHYFRRPGSHSTSRHYLEQFRKRALLSYARRMGIRVDDLAYVGRSRATGSRHYAPVVGGRALRTRASIGAEVDPSEAHAGHAHPS